MTELIDEIVEIIPPEEKAAELFVPNGLDRIIGLIRKEVEQFQPDISNDKGRKAIASLARKVASSKSRLEDYGKNLSAKIKIQAIGIDAERKRMRETLDELRDQARKPLDDYEAAVKARVDAHEQALKDVADLGNVPFGADVSDIERRTALLAAFSLRSWEEFSERYKMASSSVATFLAAILAETKKRDEERIAFNKMEEERIARESAEARERQAKEQSDRDDRVAREASERAVAAEQKRAADAEAAEAAEAKAREKDKAHKAKVHSAALAALVSIGVSDVDGKKVVTAIAQGKIPSVKVVY